MLEDMLKFSEEDSWNTGNFEQVRDGAQFLNLFKEERSGINLSNLAGKSSLQRDTRTEGSFLEHLVCEI